MEGGTEEATLATRVGRREARVLVRFARPPPHAASLCSPCPFAALCVIVAGPPVCSTLPPLALHNGAWPESCLDTAVNSTCVGVCNPGGCSLIVV